MSRLIDMVCDIDDFCKWFEPLYTKRLLQSGQRQRPHQTELALSEMLSIERAGALPALERDRLLATFFEPALLVFDLRQQKRHSLIQRSLARHRAEVRQAIENLGRASQGILIFGAASGVMRQVPAALCRDGLCRYVVDELLSMFEHPWRFGYGRCPLATIVENDFVCASGVVCSGASFMKDLDYRSIIGRIAALSVPVQLGLAELQAIAFLERRGGLDFGARPGSSRDAICIAGSPPPALPWSEPQADIFSCLLAERRAYEASLDCETIGVDAGDDIILGGGAVDDQDCVTNPLADEDSGDADGDGFDDDCDGDGCKVVVHRPKDSNNNNSNGSSGNSSSKNRTGNEPREPFGRGEGNRSRSEEESRASVADAYLNTAKSHLGKGGRYNGPIRRAIVGQCGTYGGGRGCNGAGVDAAIVRAIANTHYTPGEPGTDHDANADTCTKGGGCNDLGYGDVRIDSRLLISGSDQDILQVVMHELLHHVYADLGFAPDSGPITGPDGYVDAGPGRSHHRLIDQIVRSGNGRRIYHPRGTHMPGPDGEWACSAAARRARAQMACVERRIDLGMGRDRSIYPPWNDPRKQNWHPDMAPVDPLPCTGGLGNGGAPVNNQPSYCKIALCATEQCACGGLGTTSVLIGVNVGEFRCNARTIRCADGEELDQGTCRCLSVEEWAVDPESGGFGPDPEAQRPLRP